MLLMMMRLVALLYCVLATKACLQCDSTIRALHKDLVLSAPTKADQRKVQMISDSAFVNYQKTSMEQGGVIDPTTLYRARTEYQSEVSRFLKEVTGWSVIKIIQVVDKGRNILKKHLEIFISEGLCPNTCGYLNQRVMDCASCSYKIHKCSSPTGQQECGEYPVEAEEGGQAVLSCFLPWHRLLFGNPEYHYSWAQVVPGTKELSEDDFKPLVVTDDSSVILNQLHMDEQGTYRCSLQDNDIIFYQVTFLLTVTPLPDETLPPNVTLPTVPPGDSPSQSTEGLLVLAIAMVTALSLAASVGLTIVLGIMMNQWRATREPRRSGKWETTTQNMV